MKYDGPEKMINGEQWWWCDYHIMEGVYNGLYVKHPPDEHNDWLKRKKGGKRGKRDKKMSDDCTPTDSAKTAKLTLSNNLKAAMVTNFNCSEVQANKLWSDVVQNSSVN